MPLAARISHTLLHALRPPLDRRELDGRLSNYLQHVAAARIGVAAVAAGTQSRVGQGRNTAVRRWETESQGTLFARGWRFDRRMRPAAAHAAAGRLMQEAGLRVPEILLLDDTVPTALRWRLEAVVERAAPGNPLLECIGMNIDEARRTPWSEAIVGAVAADLARLHGKTGAAWGMPWRPENEMADPKSYWLGRLLKLGSRIAGKTVSLDAVRVAMEMDELALAIEKLPLERPALVHGDLSPAHLFAEPDGAGFKLTWIDFETVHCGHPAEDWAVVRLWPMPAGTFEQLRRKAVEAAGGTGQAAEADFCAAMDLFERLRLWEKLGSRIVKRTQREGELSAERRERLAAEQAEVERQIAGLDLRERQKNGAAA